MEDNKFLSIQKTVRWLTIFFAFCSALGGFLIFALLMGNHAIQVNSITAKVMFFLIGALSTITFAHMTSIMSHVKKDGEASIEENVFLKDAVFQTVSLLAVSVAFLSFGHLLKQPYVYQIAIDNSHLLISLTYTLVVISFLAGFGALIASLMKNYSINHPEVIEQAPLKVSLNTKSQKEERKAPRKK